MKSNVFGISAKLVLAVLVVCGTIFTSCYEEKGVDVTPVDPLPSATYTIVGNVYSSITSASISVTSTELTANKGTLAISGASYSITGLNAEDVVTISVEKDGYFPVTRVITIGKSADGTSTIINADIALVSASDLTAVDPEGAETVVTDPSAGVPTTAENLASLMPAGLSFTNEGGGADLTFTNGETKVLATQNLDLTAISIPAYVETEVTRFVESFLITDVTVEAATKAVSDIDPAILTYLAKCVSKAKNIPYAGSTFMTEKVKLNIWQEANKAVIGVRALTTLAVKSLSFVFEGKLYTVEFMIVTQGEFSFVYDTHDSHDSHDSHDGHGGSSNAGGGIGGSDL